MRFIDFKDRFPTEEHCKQAFKEHREQVGIVCKKCKGRSHYWLNSKQMYQCKNNKCRFRTSLKSGTVMENSKLSYTQWFLAMHLMTSAKMHLSALEVQRQIGHKYYEPVWNMMQKIRLAMGKRDEEYTLLGSIELDEGYFSNSKPLETNEFTGKTEELKRGVGSQKKSKVLVMNSFTIKKPDLTSEKYKHNTIPKYLKMKVIESVSALEIDKEVKHAVNKQSYLITDDNRAYTNLKNLVYKHTPHNVDKKEVEKVLPWVHKAISNAKSILNAVYKGVTQEYLQNYLNEFCYKYNRRDFGSNVFDRLLITCASYTWF